MTRAVEHPSLGPSGSATPLQRIAALGDVGPRGSVWLWAGPHSGQLERRWLTGAASYPGSRPGGVPPGQATPWTPALRRSVAERFGRFLAVSRTLSAFGVPPLARASWPARDP
jgi:hypothetical protein